MHQFNTDMMLPQCFQHKIILVVKDGRSGRLPYSLVQNFQYFLRALPSINCNVAGSSMILIGTKDIKIDIYKHAGLVSLALKLSACLGQQLKVRHS